MAFKLPLILRDGCFCAAKYKMGARHKLGRFRMTGVPSSVGVQGVHEMLHPHGWAVEEVEYAGEESITFLAGTTVMI